MKVSSAICRLAASRAVVGVQDGETRATPMALGTYIEATTYSP